MAVTFTRTGAQIEEIHNTVDDPKSNAQFSGDIRTIAGEYRGLWPDTGGSANKGDTYQTQVSGTSTGQYFTALQNTTADPIGDNVNWRSIVSNKSLGGVASYQAASVADMIVGKTVGGTTIPRSDWGVWTISGYYGERETGGGSFKWVPNGDKINHDGGATIDPDIVFYTLGDESSINAWYNGSGATSQSGVLVRVTNGTITDDDYGVLPTPSYSYNEAFLNRKAYEKMLRNTDRNDFTFNPKVDPVFVWGSVNVGRDDITIRHLSGCDIRGRYSDPAESASGQAGHMFGFVKYANPYPGTDYTVTGVVNKNNYILDGEASTIFDSGHTQLHNNNAIAFFDCEDCSVTGEGGIPRCDHNAIAFDGKCINPKVDVAYIKEYDDRAVTMKGTEGISGSCKVHIGTLKGNTRAGTVGESILVSDYTYADVKIEDAFLNETTLGVLVNSIGVRRTKIDVGYIENAQFICSLVDSGSVFVTNARYRNVTWLVRRGGASPAVYQQERVVFTDLVCEEGNNGTLYLSQVTDGMWEEFRVHDCDFGSATGTLTPYAGLVTPSAPDLINFKNNIAPSGWVYNSNIWNEQLDRPNTAVGSSSAVFDVAGTNGDSPYKNITLILTHSSGAQRIPVSINLEDLFLTSADYLVSAIADDSSILEVIVSRVGTIATFTLTSSAGSGSISSYSLWN
jgi:hypothetical protein